jgi:hypothetical protein
MKPILFLTLFVSTCTFAGYSYRPKTPQPGKAIDASVNNIPIAYDTTAGSQLYTFTPSLTAFDIYNDTAVDIALKVNVTTLDCDSATGDTHYIPAGVGLSKDNIAIGKAICLRSLGAAITTGTVYVSVD